MRARIGLVIFDCDGVLVDSEMIACGVEARALTAAGHPITAAEVAHRYAGVSDADMRRTIEEESGRKLPDDHGARCAAEVEDVFRRELRAVQGIAAVVDAVKASGRQVCSRLEQRARALKARARLDRPLGAFRPACVQRQDGRARQAGAGPVPPRGPRDGRRAGRLPRRRGQCARHPRRPRRRHDGDRLYRRPPLRHRPRRAPARGRRRAHLRRRARSRRAAARSPRRPRAPYSVSFRPCRRAIPSGCGVKPVSLRVAPQNHFRWYMKRYGRSAR